MTENPLSKAGGVERSVALAHPTPRSGIRDYLRQTTHSGGDLVEPSIQRSAEGICSGASKQKKYNGADTSADDHVLERHHALLVRAKTLQRFRGLKIMLQHRRKFLLYTMNLHLHITSATQSRRRLKKFYPS